MNERVLRLLEFFKIRERVKEECATPYGRERAQGLFPLPTMQEAQDALMFTSEGHAVYRLKGVPPFPETPDIRPAIARAKLGGILAASDLLHVAITANRSRRVHGFLASLTERVELPRLMGIAIVLSISRTMEDEVFACLDEEGLVKDHASAELAKIRRSIHAVQDRTKRALDEMVRSPRLQKYLQDTIVTMRDDRYCLAVRADSQQQVRGIVHDASASGSTLFIEPERVLQLGNELRRLKAEEEREVERILLRLSTFVCDQADALRTVAEALGEVDFALAKARYASALRAEQPTLVAEPRIHIRDGRHPMLDPQAVVPVDVALGETFGLLIITGPNTGGKTVTLKTVGLLTVMALSGLFLPALAGTVIGWFPEVFADIGDEQSIEQNLSTFSSHMRNIVHILEQANRQSLVLFDELGAGTDPIEGAALAMAILDHLRAQGIRVMATTHYSELKAYGYTTPDTMNASMEFDVDTLAPTYRLLMGVPGRSNAFAIAARLGMSRAVIEQAQQKLSTHDIRVEDLIVQLEASVLNARREEAELKAAGENVRRMELALLQERERETAERAERRKKADDETRVVVKRAQRVAEELLAELRDTKAAQKTLKDHEVVALRNRLDQLAPKSTLHTAARSRARHGVEVGDEVRVLALAGQKAMVIEKRVESKELVVAAGAMKLKVPEAQVELVRRAQKLPEPLPMVTRSSGDVAPQLDLRGTTVEEAMVEVDRYLDRALLAGFPQVTLIHGKGTGALRQGLQEYLRSHPHVKGARLGREGEGGSGVTVIELK